MTTAITFQQRAEELVARLDADGQSNPKSHQIRRDLQQIEKKLSTLRAAYTSAYERVTQLERQLKGEGSKAVS